MEWILLLFIGIIAGTIGSLLGLGGGIIVVPSLLYIGQLGFMDISPQVAVGTSLLSIIATGLSSTLSYYKKGLVDIKSGLIFFIGSGPGAIVGAWINGFLNVSSFSLYFGIFIIFISFILFVKDKLKPIGLSEKSIKKVFFDPNGNQFEYGYNPILAIVISFFVGFTAGLFGVGGGALMVPVMLILFSFPAHVAVATSMFMIILSSVTSSITHLFLGNIEWMLALILIPGAWFGAKIGAYLNAKLKPKTVVLLLRIFLLVVGVRLIYEGF
jgi:uncharacterized protein